MIQRSRRLVRARHARLRTGMQYFGVVCRGCCPSGWRSRCSHLLRRSCWPSPALRRSKNSAPVQAGTTRPARCTTAEGETSRIGDVRRCAASARRPTSPCLSMAGGAGLVPESAVDPPRLHSSTVPANELRASTSRPARHASSPSLIVAFRSLFQVIDCRNRTLQSWSGLAAPACLLFGELLATVFGERGDRHHEVLTGARAWRSSFVCCWPRRAGCTRRRPSTRRASAAGLLDQQGMVVSRGAGDGAAAGDRI